MPSSRWPTHNELNGILVDFLFHMDLFWLFFFFGLVLVLCFFLILVSLPVCFLKREKERYGVEWMWK